MVAWTLGRLVIGVVESIVRGWTGGKTCVCMGAAGTVVLIGLPTMGRWMTGSEV